VNKPSENTSKLDKLSYVSGSRSRALAPRVAIVPSCLMSSLPSGAQATAQGASRQASRLSLAKS